MTTTLDLGRWCILRCASIDTLAIADSLAEAGFEVWTPVERRFGASMSRDSDRRAAIMPGFVFADSSQAPALNRMTLIPDRAHRKFWLFRWGGGWPLIADAELDGLRREEERRTRWLERLRRRGRRPVSIEPGTKFRMTEGAYAGLDATVRRQRGDTLFVDIPGCNFDIQVSSVMLQAVSTSDRQQAA